MKRSGVSLFFATIGGALWASSAMAQVNLSTLVNTSESASTLQTTVGNAVQRTCGALIQQGQQNGGQGGFDLTGAQGDLFLRCNELVQTAQSIQGTTGRPRDLMIGEQELLSALQQVAGEELLSQATLTTRVTNGQFANLAGRLNALRVGGASAALGGRVAALQPEHNAERSAPSFAALSLDSRNASGGAAQSETARSRVGWFLEGSFNTGDRDQTASEDGFDFDSTSFTVGLDYSFDSAVLGASFGFDTYEADFDNNLLVSSGSVDVDGTSGSIFGAFYRGSWYVDAIVSVGNLDTDTSRNAVYVSNNTGVPCNCPGENDTLTGSTDGDFIASGGTIGFDAVRGNWDIGASVSVAYRDIDIDGYTEGDAAGGGLALSYADQTIESFRTVVGLAFTGNYSRDFGILSPQFRLEWHHEFQDDPVPLVAKYAVEEQLTVPGAAGAGVFSLNGQCISCFQINSDEIDTDFGLISVGLSAVFSQRIQIYGVYDALVGIDNIASNTFSVGLRGQF